MKQCTKCGEEKSTLAFPISSKTGKPQRRCKDCYNEYMRNYVKKDGSHAERVKKIRDKKKRQVTDLKMSTGCSVCGYKKCPWALDYHHINPENKEFSVGRAVQSNLSMDRILAEINKCVLVCRNCHAEIEYGVVESNHEDLDA